jgi:hypothetical protein
MFVRNDVKLEICSFVKNFNSSAVWRILVIGLADLLVITDLNYVATFSGLFGSGITAIVFF